MSAFKKLDDRSILLTSQYIEKKWSSSIAQDSYGIQVSTGEVNSGFLFPSQSNFNSNLNYRSLKHLYYSNLAKIESKETSPISSSFESYDQTTLHDTFRTLSGSVTYISFPRNITGNFIKPGSLQLEKFDSNRTYDIVDDKEGKLLGPKYKYSPLDFITGSVSGIFLSNIKETEFELTHINGDPDALFIISSSLLSITSGSTSFLNFTFFIPNFLENYTDPPYTNGLQLTASLVDQDTGNILGKNYTFRHGSFGVNNPITENVSINYFHTGSTVNRPLVQFEILIPESQGAGSPTIKISTISSKNVTKDLFEIGDIIYGHGLGIIIDEYSKNELYSNNHFTASWSSMHPIFETQIFCPVKNYEFNYSQNPTIKDENGNLKDFATNSSFTPYISAIGLYNDANELLATAKLNQPILKSSFIDTVFKINFDS